MRSLRRELRLYSSGKKFKTENHRISRSCHQSTFVRQLRFAVNNFSRAIAVVSIPFKSLKTTVHTAKLGSLLCTAGLYRPVPQREEVWAVEACSHTSTVTQERKRVVLHDQVGAAFARTDQAFHQNASSKWTSYEFCATQTPLKPVSSNYGDDGSTKFPAATNDPLFNERLQRTCRSFFSD